MKQYPNYLVVYLSARFRWSYSLGPKLTSIWIRYIAVSHSTVVLPVLAPSRDLTSYWFPCLQVTVRVFNLRTVNGYFCSAKWAQALLTVTRFSIRHPSGHNVWNDPGIRTFPAWWARYWWSNMTCTWALPRAEYANLSVDPEPSYVRWLYIKTMAIKWHDDRKNSVYYEVAFWSLTHSG